MIRLILLLLIATPALAVADEPAPAGHFDRDAVVAASRLFGAANAVASKALGPQERALSRTDGSLADLDLALALSHGSIDDAQHALWTARLEERSGLFGQEFEALQEQITALGAGYEQAFEAALGRALAALPGIEECAPTPLTMGGGLAGPGGAPPGRACPGPDRSAEVAKAWDADPELRAFVAEQEAASWQQITTYDASQPVLALDGHPGPSWLNPADLVQLVPEAIEAIDTVDRKAESARKDLLRERAEIDPEAAEADEQRKAIVLRARALRAWSADRKAEAGALVMAAVARARRKGKKAGWAEVGACLNPAGWGGCVGDEVTDDVAERVSEDKKLIKELDAWRESLPLPP